MIGKLVAARGELDDALKIGSPIARYDAQVLTPSKRQRVQLVVRDLEKLIRELEEKQ